jgi:hypothetical protein
MGVTLRKGIHRWLHIVEENLTFCRFCGTVLDMGDTPASDLCTAIHDAHCACDRCRAVVNG